MKLSKWIVYCATLLLTTASVSKDSNPGVGLSVGSQAPDFTFLSSDYYTGNQLSQYEGQYVLLQFWAPNNAKSRIQNVQISNTLASRPDLRVKLISVAMDRSGELNRQVGSMDGMNLSDLYTVPNVLKHRTMSLYRISSSQYGNFLLNDKGVIVAKNITNKQMSELL